MSKATTSRRAFVDVVLQRFEGLLSSTTASRFAERDGLAAGLPAEVDGLRPALALLGVVRQALDVLEQAVAVHRADATSTIRP